jgi:thiol-disulfide isomerase/thioredoxin
MQPPGSFEASSAPFQPEATREFVPDVEAPVMLAESQPRRRRTWSELTAQRAEAKGVSAYPISVRPRASANDHIPSPVSREPDEPATEALATDAPTGPITGPVVTRCEFDQRGRRVKDFQLADLDGKPVGFRDIDADYILLDFWGSWCAPCRASIPHLVELQRQYDPKRFRVIGVAYEQGDVAEKMRQAREASQEFAINYTVLVAEQDGRPCPLQAALQVESFPTLVLMDRHGRILWRDKGANPMTMARLDKAIAAHTEPGIIRR